MRRPAAAAGAAAAPVEDGQLDPAPRGERRERLLRPVDLPLRGQVAAVLARVRVADHHLEPVAAAHAPASARRAARSTIAGAARRSAIVSNSGTTESGSSPCSSRTRSTSAADAVPETITVSSACGPCRARAAADRLEAPRALAVGSRRRARADARRASRGGSRTARPGAAAPRARPSAIRAPRCARRLASISVEVGEERRRATRSRRAPSRRQTNDSLRRYGSFAFCVADRGRVVRATRARRGRSTRAAHRRRRRASRDTPSARRELAHLGRGSGASASSARPLERRLDRLGARVRVAVRVAADPACRSASGGGAPGTRAGARRAARGAASSRLSSKNQSPWRISSTTRGRCARTSSVCQSAVTSSASASSTASRRGGGSAGSSSSASSRAIRTCAARTVRRVASVGCAVRTSSSESRRPPPRARSPTPARRAARTPRRATRAGRAPRARTARRRRSRWCCSAMFASWK